jgi:outer membrane protein
MMRSFFAILLCASGLAAQDLSEPYFPKPSYFRKRFLTPPTRVELQPPARLADHVEDGKLELNIKSYLDLVMANNPDIQVQKLSVEFNRNAITRAWAVFDPLGIARFTTTRAKIPSGSLLNGNVSTLNSLTQPLTLQFQQTVPTGAQYNVLFAGTKTSSNNGTSTYNPLLNDSINFNVSQPLLRGRGGYITRLPISIARSRLRAADYGFEDQLIQLIALAENAYWDVVDAREGLRVQEESLKLADAALKRARKELELGATSPLEIYQPEANYANAELAVVQARYRLAQSEDALRRQIGADLDPNFRNLPLALTETITPPEQTERLDREAAVEQALRFRPDLKNAVQNIDADDLSVRLNNDRLRPDLSFTAQYGSSGLGGIARADLLAEGLIAPIGGIGGALGSVFGFTYPAYGIGFSLRLPIRDRAAAADLADSLVQKKIDAYKQRATEQNIRLQVLTAANQVENSRESIRIARLARDLAQKRVEADQKRYELGTTTLFFVLASQSDYILAESNLVTQTIGYRRNLINFLQRTGTLLEERGIVAR